MVGLSGFDIEQAGDYLQRFDTDNPAPNPDDTLSDLLRLRFCADDIRAWYLQAALANGNPSRTQVETWFWENTRAAQELWRLYRDNHDHADSVRAAVCGRMLIPELWRL